MSPSSCIRRSLTLVRMLVILALVFPALPAPVARAAGPLHVTTGGAGNCADWTNACSLQTALGAAAPGDEIWVAAGVYTPTTGTDRTASFVLRSGVMLYGGFVGAITETVRSQRDWVANVTTLSGDIGAQGDNFDNTYHVVTADSTVTQTAGLDGFTVTGGFANGSAAAGYGGGLYNAGGSPALTNVTFSGNIASRAGGGLYNNGGSPALTNVTFSGNAANGGAGGGLYNNGGSPALTNVTFSGNAASGTGGAGGGLYNNGGSPALTNVTFSGNAANGGVGGGLYNAGGSPALTNVTFSGNAASGSVGVGGGLYNAGGSPALTNVTFSGNTAGRGGGMDNYNGSPVLTNVTFSGNTASIGSGGGMLNSGGSPVLTNVTFSGNTTSYGSGGGLYSGGSPALTNVTFSGNTASSGSGGGLYNNGGSPTLRNTILWGNTASSSAQVYTGGGGTSAISDSVVQDDCPTGSTCANIIPADPHLRALDNYGGNLQVVPLGAGSSAINAANLAYCPGTDARGYPRRSAGGFCDIGAYEAQLTSVVAANGSLQFTTVNAIFPLALQARVADAYGNLLGGNVVTFTVPAAGASAAWSGNLTITCTTDLSGTASAPALTANGIGGAFTATVATSAGSATFALMNLKGNTTTTMTSSKNPAVAGEAVIFTVTVTSSSGTPAGTVDYFERLSLGAQADAAPSLVNGVVTFTVPSLALGTHNLQALYSGDAGYEASASPVFTQVVNPLSLYPLTVNTIGSGSGTVTSLPAGLACSISCTANFTGGTVVTLTATANTGSTFTGWSGAVLTTTNPLVLTLDVSKVLTATFNTYRVYLPVVQRP